MFEVVVMIFFIIFIPYIIFILLEKKYDKQMDNVINKNNINDLIDIEKHTECIEESKEETEKLKNIISNHKEVGYTDISSYDKERFNNNLINILKLIYPYFCFNIINTFNKDSLGDIENYKEFYYGTIMYSFDIEMDINKIDYNTIKKLVLERAQNYLDNHEDYASRKDDILRRCIEDYIFRIINVLFDYLNKYNSITSNGDFYKVYTKLVEEKIDEDIIIKKLQNIFESDFNKNEVEELIQSIEINKVYTNYFRNLAAQFVQNNLRFKDIKEIINILFDSLLKHDAELSRYDISKYIGFMLIFVLENSTIDFKNFYYICLNYDEILDEIENKKKKINKEKEIERLLAGDLEVEKNKTQELFELSNINNGFEFEEYICRLYKKLGYKVVHTKLSGDQGADVIVEKDGIKTVVQAKFYNKPVANKAVQEVVASISYYAADKGIVITNNTFTKSAIELAKKNNIELIDKNSLNKLIDEIGNN